jgi:hypothetical protein
MKTSVFTGVRAFLRNGARVLFAAIAAMSVWNLAAADLSREYTFVEWIKANGNQCMNLSYWHTPTTRVETVCYYPKSGNGYYSCFFGSRNVDYKGEAFYFSGSFWGGKVMWNLKGTEDSASTTDYFYDQKITLTLDAATRKCSWVNESGASTNFTATGTATDGVCSWGLFRGNNASTHDGEDWNGYYGIYTTVYSFKIWDGETLRCDLKPAVRNSDGEIGLYDVCRKMFITNMTTTALTCGNALAGLSVGAIADQVVDGVTACSPTVTVSDADGKTLAEGVDYEVEWPNLAAPGVATVKVYGKDGTASEGLSGSATFNIVLQSDVKKRPYLPAGYVEMDGLTGTGTQYLNTGIKNKANTRVECELTCAKATSNFNAIFGQRTHWTGIAYVFYVAWNGGNNTGYNRTGVEDKGGTFTFGERTKVVTDGLEATWTSATKSGSLTATGTLTDGEYPMYVFTDNYKGTADSTSSMTLHSFRMIDDGKVSCWLVPCYREADGAVGAFDVAQWQSGDDAFRANIGKGEFVKGSFLYRPTTVDSVLDFYLENADASKMSYGWSVNDEAYVGGTLTAEYSTDENFAAEKTTTVDLGTAVAYENKSAAVTGLEPETTLYFRVTLKKDGKDDVVRTFNAMTTAAAGSLDEKSGVSLNWVKPSNPEFTCLVSRLGAGDIHRVKLYLGTDAENLELAATKDVESVGLVTISAAWPTYYEQIYYKVVYENGTGEDLYACESAAGNYTPTYKSTYTWKKAVTEGDWKDADNWTMSGCDVANPSECYPNREAYHMVVFPNSWTGVVNVAGGEECLYIKNGQWSRATLRGPAGDEIVGIKIGAMVADVYNQQTVLDHVRCDWTGRSGSTWSGSDNMRNGSGLRLENGAILEKAVSGWPILFHNAADAFLEVCGGSRLTFKNCDNSFYMKGPNTRVLIDDSEFSCNVPVGLNDAADGSVAWEFKGKAPRFVASGGLVLPGAGGATIEFSPEKGGYEQAPITVSTKVCLDGAASKATVSIAEKASVWHSGAKLDFALIESAGGINTNAFELVAPKRTSGKLYWYPEDAEKPTQLRFNANLGGLCIRIQ